MHTFKRFYLLVSLLAAFAIPFITFVEYVELPVVTQIIAQSNSNVTVVSGKGPIHYATDYLPTILWSIYGMGIVIFGWKFIRNMYQIIQRIRKNPKFKINRITNVLLLDRIIPHTFFNYVFLNKHKFEAKEIPSEVLLHEETHARQKHSLDVLFIELLQLFFWFNPLMYLMKKAIKLNHEFLADREVLDYGIKPALYQNILLEFSSSSLQPQLANSINYSSIKKRFTVMKTRTSKKSIVLRSLLILPLSALLLFGFSEKKLVELQAPVEMTIPVMEQESAVKSIDLRINKKGEILVQNNVWTSLDNLKSHLQKINTNLTKEQRENVVRVLIMPDAEAPMKIIKDIEPILIDYGVARIDIVGPEEFSNSTKEIKVQGGATKKQIEEYNALAKKYNAQPIQERIIKKKEIERLEYLYNLMTDKQKKKAQPFPECPPPPPAPKAVKGKISPTSPQPPSAPKINKGEIKNVSPASPLAPKVASKVMSNIPPNAPAVSKGEVSDIPPPPPPPPSSKSPVEHAQEMAKQGAVFYYGKKKITAAEAIDILKEKDNLSMDISKKNNNPPVVKISRYLD
ncbi:MAG: M56 family metallopeptidase [Maribacter sp.]|nr:M56 family metallopeptidase [Maribacter sp.]